jgi:hypothetical protein
MLLRITDAISCTSLTLPLYVHVCSVGTAALLNPEGEPTLLKALRTLERIDRHAEAQVRVTDDCNQLQQYDAKHVLCAASVAGLHSQQQYCHKASYDVFIAVVRFSSML